MKTDMFRKLNIFRAVGLFMAVIMLSASLCSCGAVSTVSKTIPSDSDDNLLARVIICNDIHYIDVEGIQEIMLRRMFAEAYDYSDRIDAFIFNGDLTKTGEKAEYQGFLDVVNSGVRDGTKIIMTLGSNDYEGIYYTPERVEREFNQIIGNTDTLIGGIHFIGISPEDPYGYEYDTDWLKEHLESADKENPEAPIITFQHYPVSGTIFKEYGAGTEPLKEIYEKYPQIINLAGHVNYPVTHPFNIDQDVFTAVGLGTIGSYINFPDSIEVGTQNNYLQRSDAHNFVIVEIFDDYSVKITPYCVESNRTYLTAADEELFYLIEEPGNKDKYKYTLERIVSEDKDPPEFPEGSEINIDKIQADSCAVSFPAAVDDCAVNYYELRIIDPKNDQFVSKAFVRSLYWVVPHVTSYSKSMSGMVQNKLYYLYIFAYDVTGHRSPPLKITFTQINTY